MGRFNAFCSVRTLVVWADPAALPPDTAEYTAAVITAAELRHEEPRRAKASVDVELVALGVLHPHRVVIEAVGAHDHGERGPEIRQPPGLGSSGSLQSMTSWNRAGIALPSAQQWPRRSQLCHE
jgi:hypothetical protein